MKFKNIIGSKLFQACLSAIIIAAIVLSLVLPGGSFTVHEHENPIAQQEITDITVLNNNENLGELTTIIIPNGEGDEKSDQEPTEEDEESDPDIEKSPDPADEKSDTPPDDVEPEKENTEENGDGAGDEGQEDGKSGEEGGENTEPDLSLVMTWYKYGAEPRTIVCPPSELVTKGINTAQLKNNKLRYDFSVYGEDAGDLEITEVSVAVGNGAYEKTVASGEIAVSVPDGIDYRNYTFKVKTAGRVRMQDGGYKDREITFTFIIRIDDSLDLDMELVWNRADGSKSAITCAADKTAAKTIESADIIENVFTYSPRLVGTAAEDTQIISGEYTTASGESGELSVSGGALILSPELGKDSGTYYLTFAAHVKTVSEGESLETTVYFKYTIIYRHVLDAKLNFVWYEKGQTARSLICNPGDSAQTNVKNNQLSAGAVKYEMSLEGADTSDGRILSVYYESLGTGGGSIPESGSLPMTLPTGGTSNTYTITVTALVGTQRIIYTVVLKYTNDISLEMKYAVNENGASVPKIVTCENGKKVTPEVIYDDQLTDGVLNYTLAITGEDSRGVSITEVSCYRSGNSKTVMLEASGQVQLLLKGGKTGENNFKIKAEDTAGTVYEFEINIPYKHRGAATVNIETNLTDGMSVTNETVTNLSVKAWSVDENGKTTNIFATGTDTTLIVKLDGEVVPYVTTSGAAQEYNLIPKNPETGDTNRHTLYIYAEDSLGNFGEKTITLIGNRSQDGQEKGTATLYIDLTTLGLGVQGPVTYTVLANEPVSYAVAKAVWGYDAGQPFGKAENTFGWAGANYGGSLDTGFYLKSMSPGGTVNANALTGLSWSSLGADDEAIYQYIDNKFGKGSGLASLWRCIYRNGLALSTAASASAISEHDYTSGSGWSYSLNGVYYPGKSMAEFFLQPGDVLTLRFTLAYGWDISGGTTGYGNNVGYCVTCLNGNITVNHQMEQKIAENGAISYVCTCCGLAEDCAHENIKCMDLGDGTHSVFCNDCKTYISDPAAHTWVLDETDSDDNHTCTECGLKEAHALREVDGTNTATCTESGERTMQCTICANSIKQEAPAKGHAFDNTWYHNAQSHWQMCQVCRMEVTESAANHSYIYNSEDDDWYCAYCSAGHDWDYCGNAGLTVTGTTCTRIDYYCGVCGLYMHKDGTFEEYHSYTGGACVYCGASDPDYIPPEEENGGEEGGETEEEIRG